MNSPSSNQQLPVSPMFGPPGGGGDAGGYGFEGFAPGFGCPCGCGGLGACAGAPPDVVTPDMLTNAASGVLSSAVPFSGATVNVDESAYATTVSYEAVCETIAALHAAASQAYTPNDRDLLSSMVLTFGAALAIRKISCDPCAIEELREKSASGDSTATAILQGVATMAASDLKRMALVLSAEGAVGSPAALCEIQNLAYAAGCGDLTAQNVIVIVEQIFPQGLPTCTPCMPMAQGQGFPQMGQPGQYGGPPPMNMGGGAGSGLSTYGSMPGSGPVQTPGQFMPVGQ